MTIRKEISGKQTATIFLNGKKINTVEFTPENMLGTTVLEIDESKLRSGENIIGIALTGKGRLYANAFLTYFSKEKPITPAGNEIYLKREYFREVVTPRLAGGINTRWEPLKDGDSVKSGERIEARLFIEAKNDYEYLLLEDKRPAGWEAEQIRSGERMFATKKNTAGEFVGETTYVYQEMRDQHAAFFMSQLREGTHRIKYLLRAETPGTFHGLPAQIHAMYVPEIKGNSEGIRVQIKDE